MLRTYVRHASACARVYFCIMYVCVCMVTLYDCMRYREICIRRKRIRANMCKSYYIAKLCVYTQTHTYIYIYMYTYVIIRSIVVPFGAFGVTL